MSDEKNLIERVENLENDTKLLTKAMMETVNLLERFNDNFRVLNKEINRTENKGDSK